MIALGLMNRHKICTGASLISSIRDVNSIGIEITTIKSHLPVQQSIQVLKPN